MKEQIKKILHKFTNHPNIELTSRGNTAIFVALYCARKLNLDKKTVLIPDQGGWLTYKKYPNHLEMKIIELKTDDGIININELKRAIEEHDVNCLLYENPAGYFADQPIKEIYDVCKGKCNVIMDVAGCIGDEELCNGQYADFMVGSFGRWKIVDAGYGGFISAKTTMSFETSQEIFNTTEFDEKHAPLIIEKLQDANKRFNRLYEICENIKKDLNEKNIVHKNKKGIVVVVGYDNEKDKQDIIDYCEKHKYDYTQCPRYIRIMKDAISIEVKRLG